VLLTLTLIGLSVGNGFARQPPRALVAIEATGGDPLAAAFAAALRTALASTKDLALAPDKRKIDINVVIVGSPVQCGERATSAIAIGAHRLGRALASQWVNVIVADQSQLPTYAERAAADIAAALTR
jgi:hypothetical protein